MQVSQKKNRRLFALPLKNVSLDENARGRYSSMRKKWPYFKTICMAVGFCLILIAYCASFTLCHDIKGATVTAGYIERSCCAGIE